MNAIVDVRASEETAAVLEYPLVIEFWINDSESPDANFGGTVKRDIWCEAPDDGAWEYSRDLHFLPPGKCTKDSKFYLHAAATPLSEEEAARECPTAQPIAAHTDRELAHSVQLVWTGKHACDSEQQDAVLELQAAP